MSVRYAPGDAWVKTFSTVNPATQRSQSADETPVAEVRRNGVLDPAVAITVDNTGVGLYKASGTIPEGYDDGDRFEVLVTAVVEEIEATEVAESIRLEAAATDAGDGDVAVNHNTGGTDALRVMSNGSGVDDCVIRAYLKDEYDAGLRVRRGRSITGTDGRWIRDMMLDPDTYILTFDARGYDLQNAEVTVAD